MHCIFCYQNPIFKINSSEKKSTFLLQDKYNKLSLKTCGCKAHYYCKKVEEEVNSVLKITKKT
jgi:hypothetical protein